MTEPEPAVESPCIAVCRLDEASGFCRGCGRSLAEIAGWLGFTPEHRRAVMATLASRLAVPVAE